MANRTKRRFGTVLQARIAARIATTPFTIVVGHAISAEASSAVE
jgi:hypothetical protein